MDAPGVASNRLTTFNYQYIPKPIWPLQDIQYEVKKGGKKNGYIKRTYYIEVPASLNPEQLKDDDGTGKRCVSGMGAVDEQTLVPLPATGNSFNISRKVIARPIAICEVLRAYNDIIKLIFLVLCPL